MDNGIYNVKIKEANLCEDHCCITLKILVEGDEFQTYYGGYSLGRYGMPSRILGPCCSEYNTMDAIGELMCVLGVDSFNKINGTYARVDIEDNSIKKIGNIIKNNWFSFKEYFDRHKTLK